MPTGPASGAILQCDSAVHPFVYGFGREGAISYITKAKNLSSAWH